MEVINKLPKYLRDPGNKNNYFLTFTTDIYGKWQALYLSPQDNPIELKRV